MSKLCKKCMTSGIRLYRPMYSEWVYCHDCLIASGGTNNYDEVIFRGELAYLPMTIDGCICFSSDDFERWKTQPIRISDLYEPGSAKYLESEIKISNLQIQN